MCVFVFVCVCVCDVCVVFVCGVCMVCVCVWGGGVAYMRVCAWASLESLHSYQYKMLQRQKEHKIR